MSSQSAPSKVAAEQRLAVTSLRLGLDQVEKLIGDFLTRIEQNGVANTYSKTAAQADAMTIFNLLNNLDNEARTSGLASITASPEGTAPPPLAARSASAQRQLEELLKEKERLSSNLRTVINSLG
ncbi:hypothetical protein BZG36_03505 [Bifiguratus adelaidae]|uniref:Uncharacterized protein n=1 Tax=Bifiguratus adelaidae TaxID=1938954 RepID=A0A261XZD0_9FUNG|nr:hypothetical protein BZG36_03505 [Bifiguratus adelaidae]